MGQAVVRSCVVLRVGRGQERPWKLLGSETNSPKLKDKDVCNLRSHVLGISGVSSLDKLVNKLNYAANESA